VPGHHRQRCPASMTKAELASMESARRTRKACAFNRVFTSVPPHPSAEGEGHRGKGSQSPRQAHQVRLHNPTPIVRPHRRPGGWAVCLLADPWLCVPASRRVCPDRGWRWRWLTSPRKVLSARRWSHDPVVLPRSGGSRCADAPGVGYAGVVRSSGDAAGAILRRIASTITATIPARSGRRRR
jgi:hypothetical protein